MKMFILIFSTIIILGTLPACTTVPKNNATVSSGGIVGGSTGKIR